MSWACESKKHYDRQITRFRFAGAENQTSSPVSHPGGGNQGASGKFPHAFREKDTLSSNSNLKSDSLRRPLSTDVSHDAGKSHQAIPPSLHPSNLCPSTPDDTPGQERHVLDDPVFPATRDIFIRGWISLLHTCFRVERISVPLPALRLPISASPCVKASTLGQTGLWALKC